VHKKYTNWFVRKKYVNNIKNREYFYEREIWYCYVGENVGHEQDGKGKDFLRPVLIYKKFNKHTGLIIPLTSKNKAGLYYFNLEIGNRKSNLILSQIKFFDAKRLLYRLDRIDVENFKTVKNKITTLLS